MASVSASHLIIFIASVLVAASVAGTITNTVGELSGAITDQGVDVSNDVRTDIEVISDSGSQVYDRFGVGKVALLVKNTGSNRLSPSANGLDVVMDGAYRTAVDVTVVGSDTPNSWGPGDVVRLNVSAPDLPAGDHRVKLTINGDEEVFQFNS